MVYAEPLAANEQIVGSSGASPARHERIKPKTASKTKKSLSEALKEERALSAAETLGTAAGALTDKSTAGPISNVEGQRATHQPVDRRFMKGMCAKSFQSAVRAHAFVLLYCKCFVGVNVIL